MQTASDDKQWLTFSAWLDKIERNGASSYAVGWLSRNVPLHVEPYLLALWQHFPEWELTERQIAALGLQVVGFVTYSRDAVTSEPVPHERMLLLVGGKVVAEF